MVAVITTPHRISGVLNYNEQKVKKGTAECIHAGNFLLDAGSLKYHQKLATFENLNSLNERATTKTLHISLNFDPKEKLSKERLVKIAETYMDKIGFGNQPFLVYHHHDAGHPHIHVVTTTIRADGSRINTHNIGRNQSEKARKEIEQSFNLVKAGKDSLKSVHLISPVDIQKAQYGKHETKRSITNIVTAVFKQYKFCSLPEFNAALRQFNVVADRGREEGRIFKTEGLIYRLLDEQGNKVGVPIKASSIPSKPTLLKLKERFLADQAVKQSHKELLKATIDQVVQQTPGSIENFKNLIAKEKVFVLLRLSAEGKPYGVTFVDNISKCVFNGSDLGKQYSIAALTNRIYRNEGGFQKEEKVIVSQSTQRSTYKQHGKESTEISLPEQIKSSANYIELADKLIAKPAFIENIPFQLKRKRRKKKKANIEH